jgi:glycosyltransferase involved in cell wall biosynthesis
MGRFVPEKNFHQLIHAFAALGQHDYKLVLAGDADFEDDYSKSLKQLARENGVILTGFIKGKKLQELLSHARCFVLPSSHEGLPISLLEAMSYELPAVVSDIPANKEVGLPDECYFRVNDEQQLQDRLGTLLMQEYHAEKYSMDNYDWDKIAMQVVAVYNSMMKIP